MAVKKQRIYDTLRPAHLQAIGKVAANWNELEFSLLTTLAKVANIEMQNLVTLVGSQNVTAWCEMLKTFAAKSEEYAWKADQLTAICQSATELIGKRNSIVHSAWLDTRPMGGMLSPGLPFGRPSVTAEGIGIKKRGTSQFIVVHHTAVEMRTIAKEIVLTTQAFLAWLHRRKPQGKPLGLLLGDLLAHHPSRPKRKQPRKPPET